MEADEAKSAFNDAEHRFDGLLAFFRALASSLSSQSFIAKRQGSVIWRGVLGRDGGRKW
jgi:hypothetical protein